MADAKPKPLWEMRNGFTCRVFRLEWIPFWKWWHLSLSTRWAFQVSADLVILSTWTHTHTHNLALEHNCSPLCKKFLNSAHLIPACLRLMLHVREIFLCSPCPWWLPGPPSLQLLYLLSDNRCWAIDLCPPPRVPVLRLNAGSALLVNLTLHASASLVIP